MPDRVASPASYSTRASLIQRLRQSDSDGWEHLVNLYQPLLWHWCRRCGGEPQDFDDVCQDVFKVVATRIGSFELGEHHGSFRAWLRSITRNVCRERVRRTGAAGRGAGGTEAGALLQQVPAPGIDDEDPPALVGELNRRAIALVRGEFSEMHWRVFERLTLDERTPAEVAAELGLTPVNVRAIKSRIYRRLREELGEVMDALPGPP